MYKFFKKNASHIDKMSPKRRKSALHMEKNASITREKGRHHFLDFQGGINPSARPSAGTHQQSDYKINNIFEYYSSHL